MIRRTPPLTTLALLAAAALAGAAHGAEPAAGTGTPAAVEKVIVRAVARFGFDSVALDPQDQARLLAEVGEMKDVSWQTVVATGHTDSIGNPAYNASLAARRAAAVKDYLLGKGLPPALVRTAARGPAQPVADNLSADGRARNRRAEVVFEGVRPMAR